MDWVTTRMHAFEGLDGWCGLQQVGWDASEAHFKALNKRKKEIKCLIKFKKHF